MDDILPLIEIAGRYVGLNSAESLLAAGGGAAAIGRLGWTYAVRPLARTAWRGTRAAWGWLTAPAPLGEIATMVVRELSESPATINPLSDGSFEIVTLRLAARLRPNLKDPIDAVNILAAGGVDCRSHLTERELARVCALLRTAVADYQRQEDEAARELVRESLSAKGTGILAAATRGAWKLNSAAPR